MQWISDPENAGAWLRARLDENLGVVPEGYEAYARVFHPASVQWLPDRAMPEMAEWERLPHEEQSTLIDQMQDAVATWSETARAFGTTMHSLAQWQRLVRTPPGGDWNTRIAPDGRAFDAPAEDSMPPALLAPLAAHLTAHTRTPDAGVAAIWNGFGGLLGFFGANPSRSFFSFSDDPNHQRLLERSAHDVFNNMFRKPVWQDGILSREISEGAQLELPGRAYVLFAAPPRAFADPAWILDAPWRDRPAEEHGFEPSAQHPNILWPEDHAWVMVSEIDFDSTIVAGSAELIAAICADDRLEALEIPAGADLTWDGDTVNS